MTMPDIRPESVQLLWHYMLALAAAAVAGLIGMVVTFTLVRGALCDPHAPTTCPDGIAYVIPTLTGGLCLAFPALGGCLLMCTRHAKSQRVRQYARAALWLAVVAVCLLWLVPLGMLALINDGATLTTMLIAVGFALPVVIPLAVEKALPRAVVPSLGLCLLACASVPVLRSVELVPIQLVPAATACGGTWLVALVLHIRAHRARAREDDTQSPLTHRGPT